MYDINWYMQNALVLALLVETFKRSGGHWLRDNLLPRIPRLDEAVVYPLLIKGIAFVVALVWCFGAKADVLLTLEIGGFAPEVGYILGGVLLVGGDTLIDAVWDKRKVLAEIGSAWLRGGSDAPLD